MRPRELALLIVLGAIWGMSYVFIRVAAPVMGPVLLMEFRFAVGGAALVGYAAATGLGRSAFQDLRSNWRVLAVAGVFFAALPTTLIGFAELRISASLATVLNAATPFFAAAGSAVWLGEGFPRRRAVGLITGIVGVALAVGTQDLVPAASDILSVGASLTAAASYGLVGVYLRRVNPPVHGVSFALGALVLAAVFLVPPTAGTYHPFAWSTWVEVSALGLALLSTAVAYIIYYYLLERVGPTRATTVTFVSPAFGILGGIVLLHESAGPGLIGGLALIVVGLWLTTQGTAPPPGPSPSPVARPSD